MIVKIKEVARKKKNWSLYKLAQMMGLPQQTVYSWANGRTQPSYPNMDYLCSVLGCSLTDLFEPEFNSIQ
jgi:transcriptional regulator with XRE-family HTH domain